MRKISPQASMILKKYRTSSIVSAPPATASLDQEKLSAKEYGTTLLPPTVSDDMAIIVDTTSKNRKKSAEPKKTALGTSTRKFKGYPLTVEQDHAVDLMLSGDDVKIEAYAGSGKTSTLAAGASVLTGKGLYIAFNAAIAEQAKLSFPSSVECRTAHSLAYAAIGKNYHKDRLNQRLNGTVVAEHLNLPDFILGFSKAQIGNLVIEGVNRFVQSADQQISIDHAPWGSLRVIEDKNDRLSLASCVLPFIQRIWAMMINQNHSIPITHDVYLKQWALMRPVLKKDYILFDEAQDANGLMLDLVGRQQSQQIYVGDRYQQIYSWRGAVNAMQTLDIDHACRISQSFRFGQRIADVANDILSNFLNAEVDIKGFEKVKSTVGSVAKPNAILCRTNGALITAILGNINEKRVAVTGGCSDLIGLLNAAKDLQQGRTTVQRDLALFKNWSDVVDFSETDAGSDLKLLVKLVDKHDIDDLIKALKSVSTDEKKADLVISTAHKSKGKEWNTVALANDFRHPKQKSFSDEEANLLYVAATRAIKNLDIEDCEAAQKAIQPT